MSGPEAGNARAPEDEDALAADRRGDATAAFNLAGLLAERDDLAAAVAAFRRADERGHGAGAANLGLLLEQQGDLEGAEAAYRRAAARGDGGGAFNLGGLLADRGDLAGAAVAFHRAAADTDPEAAKMAREALLSLTPLAADSDTHDDRGHARNDASLLLRPRMLLGVGAVMIVLGIAGLAEGKSHIQTNAPSSRAAPPSVNQRPGWSSDQSGIDRRRSQKPSLTATRKNG